MKATFKSLNVPNGKNYSGEKELVSAFSVIGKIDGEPRDVVTCRCYMGRSSSASVVYASIWVHNQGVYVAGHGQAGGYGYHKESAAIGSAISSAGITLTGSPYADENGMVYKEFPNPEWSQSAYDAAHAESAEAGNHYSWSTPKFIRKLVKDAEKNEAHISGCGDQAVRSALLAIARAAGVKGKLLIVSH